MRGKIRRLLLVLGCVISLLLAGCGKEAVGETETLWLPVSQTAENNGTAAQGETEKDPTGQEESKVGKETEGDIEALENSGEKEEMETPEDEDAEVKEEESKEIPETAEAFAESVQEAFADQDMEALESLVSYPCKISRDGTVLATVYDESQFLSQDPSLIFGDDLLLAIANVDTGNLHMINNRVEMGQEQKIVFQLRDDGELGITEIYE